MERKSDTPLEMGVRIGHWTLLSSPIKVGRDYKVDCQCRCGTRKKVSAISLRAGHSRHCGCATGEENHALGRQVEARQFSSDTIEELELISRGHMPLADQFRVHDGAPTWTLASFAALLGLSREALLRHLHQSGAKFADGIKSQLLE